MAPRSPFVFPLGAVEIIHLALSVLGLTLAFTFSLSGSALIGGSEPDVPRLLSIAPSALLIVLSAFLLHELSHKFLAGIRGLWSEFRASWVNLLGGVLLSAGLGVVVAAPGAVVIYGEATRREEGAISLAGPLVNVVLGALSLGAFLYLPEVCVARELNFWGIATYVNLGLAAFNMIPVLPLDGAKIWRWSKLAYLVVALLVALLAYGFFNPSLFPSVGVETRC